MNGGRRTRFGAVKCVTDNRLGEHLGTMGKIG